MRITQISAVTLFIKDMEKSVSFYTRLPEFEIVFGGQNSDFTSFRVSKNPEMFLNLELSNNPPVNFGRIIFYTDNVDKLFEHLKNDDILSKLGCFESNPRDASWGERYFHMRDPDGYEISFAKKLNT